MAKKTKISFRVFHRYLGFFLVGIWIVYAISGTILIFRDTDYFKQEKLITKEIKPNAESSELGQLLGISQLKVEKEEGDVIYFNTGSYNKITGKAEYTVLKLPYVLERMTNLHKVRSANPLFFINIIFAASLLFFVISAFRMYPAKSAIFKKGLIFTCCGVVFTLLLLFVG